MKRKKKTSLIKKGILYTHSNIKIKLFDDQYFCKIIVSAERYDEAIDQALDDNDIEYEYSNPQYGDADFDRYNEPIQASIADLTE